MRIPLTCIVAALLSCTSVLSQEIDPPETKAYRDGYKQGVAEAERELKEGHPTLYASGLRLSLENLDKDTGLPFRFIAGCVIDDQIVGREQGHDAKIREHIKLHGLPASSFKRWQKELFALKEYYIARTKTEKPIPLAVGGPECVSVDEKVTVTPVQTPFKKDDGTIGYMLGIVVAARGKKPVTKSILWATDETDFLWGPAGSRFLVIRCNGQHGEHYMSLDIERVEWLRWE